MRQLLCLRNHKHRLRQRFLFIKKKLEQQAAQQASVPAAPAPFVQRVAEDVEKTKEQNIEEMETMQDKEAKALASLSEDERWLVYKKYVQMMIDTANKNITPNFDGKMDFNEVGMRYIIANQIVSALKDALDIVDIRRKQMEVPTDDNPTETTEGEVTK